MLYLTSCRGNNSRQKNNADWLGTGVVVPKDIMHPIMADSLWKNNSLHIIMYIDSTECTACSIDNVIIWNKKSMRNIYLNIK